MDDDGGVDVGSAGSVQVEGDASGGEAGGFVAAAVPTPAVGVLSGGRLSSTSLFLSSRRLLLLARSRRRFPEGGALVATPPFGLTAGLNQRETSSVAPSVTKTNLAGTPSLLHATHAKY